MKQLIDDIIKCGTSSDHWEATLDRFNETFDVPASAMFAVRDFSDPAMGINLSSFYRNDVSSEGRNLMLSGADVDDAKGYAFLRSNPAHQFYDELVMLNVESKDQLPSSRVREYTYSQGFITRVAASLNSTGPWFDGLFCQVRKDETMQRLVNDDIYRLVLPVIGNSITMGRMLTELRRQFRAALSILDALGLAVFLVGPKGDVIDYNAAAQDVLDADDGVSLDKAKRFRLTSEQRTQMLQDLVTGAHGVLDGDISAKQTVMGISRPSGAFDYLVSARSLSDTDGELETGFQCAFVTMIDPTQQDLLQSDGLAMMGELSDAEISVVDLLINGMRPTEVAERRDVSLNTVKSQLRSISEKLRCSTQSDIVRAAAASRLPIKRR